MKLFQFRQGPGGAATEAQYSVATPPGTHYLNCYMKKYL